MAITLFFALILLTGSLAMSEVALVTAQKARRQKPVDGGKASAMAAIKPGKDPTRFLSSIHIGITSGGVLNGALALSQLVGWFQAQCLTNPGPDSTRPADPS